MKGKNFMARGIRHMRNQSLKKLISLAVLIFVFSVMIAQTTVTMFSEDWETGTADWTIENGTVANQWYRGTAAAQSGSYSMYVSDNEGETNTYNITSVSTVYFYRTVTFPANVINITLSFDVRIAGQVSQDYLRVYMFPEGHIPVASDALTPAPATTDRIGSDFQNITAWSHRAIENLDAFAGQTRVLAFMWRNNNVTGTQPPAGVDNITLTYQVPPPYPLAVTLNSPANEATSVNPENLSISWTNNKGAVPTGYKVFIGTANPPTTLWADITTTAWEISPRLNYSTTYYWRVIPYNSEGDSQSEHSVFRFSTMADPTIVSFPYNQTFTETLFPPPGWANRLSDAPLGDTNASLQISTTAWTRTTAFNNHTNHSNGPGAKTNVTAAAARNWLITPFVNLTNLGTNRVLEFDLALRNSVASPGATPGAPALTGVDDRFIILVSSDDTWSEENILALWDNRGTSGAFVYNSIANFGERIILDLGSYSGLVRIAFYGESTVANANNDIHIDNITFRTLPTTPELHVSMVNSFHEQVNQIGFGQQEIFSITEQRIRIQNRGRGTLRINDIVIPEAFSEYSIIGAPTSPVNLLTNETYYFSVRLNPQTTGEKAANVNILNNASPSTYGISLTGSSVQDFIDTYPWMEVFTQTSPAFPYPGWYRRNEMLPLTGSLTITESNTTNNRVWVRSTGFANLTGHPFGAALRIQIPFDITGAPTQWGSSLITPWFDMDAVGDYKVLEFDLALTGHHTLPQAEPNQPPRTGQNLRFFIMASNDNSWSLENPLAMWDNDPTNTSEIKKVFDEIAFTEGERIALDVSHLSGFSRFSFYVESNVSGTSNNLFVDNITVRERISVPMFSATESLNHFGDVQIHFPTNTQTVTMTNHGEHGLEIDAIWIDGSFADQFVIYNTNEMPIILNSMQSATFTVACKPTSVGAKPATLVINHNAEGGEHFIALNGNGVDNSVNFPYGQNFTVSPANWIRSVTPLAATGYTNVVPVPETTSWEYGQVASTQWALRVFGHIGNHPNTNAAYVRLTALNPNANRWLISPAINIAPAESGINQLTFDVALTNAAIGGYPSGASDQQSLALLINYGDGWSIENTIRRWTLNGEGDDLPFSSLSASGTKITIDLDDITGHVQFAFFARQIQQIGDAAFFIDNVSISNSEYVFYPPTNLSATPKDAAVELNWLAPTDIPVGELVGYGVYRNGYFVENTATNSYIDENLINGTTYSYTVTAIFNNPLAESVHSNAATARPMGDIYYPPFDLSSTVVGNDVTLEWKAAGIQDKWISHSQTDDYFSAFGHESASGALWAAQRFSHSQLTDLGVSEGRLTKIRILTGAPATNNYTYILRIWVIDEYQNATTTNANRMQAVPASPFTTWVEVELNNPITISAYQELMIGYSVSITGGGYPLSIDRGPALANFGGLMLAETGWVNLTVSGIGNVNLQIKAFVESDGSVFALEGYHETYETDSHQDLITQNIGMSPFVESIVPSIELFDSTRDLVGYHVKRGSTQITNSPVTNTTFTDLGVSDGKHTYSVWAVYTTRESIPIETDVLVGYHPPTNLVATEGNRSITLTWGLPASSSIVLNGLRVYRASSGDDNVLLTTLGTNVTTYVDETVFNTITYTYYVAANYDGTEVKSNIITATPQGEADVLLPPKNVDIRVSGNNVTLSWESPSPDRWFSHSPANSGVTGIGYQTGGTLSAVNRFNSHHLMEKGVAGAKLTKVSFYMGSFQAGYGDVVYTIKVWIGGTGTPALDPGTEIVSLPVPSGLLGSGVWVEMNLPEPITIPFDREMWIGFEATHTTTSYPIVADNAPEVVNHGNIIRWSGAWRTLSSLNPNNPNYATNLLIRGYAENIDGAGFVLNGGSEVSPFTETQTIIPLMAAVDMADIAEAKDSSFYESAPMIRHASRALNGYRIYRGGNDISGLITDLTYIDERLPIGIHTYHLVAVYTSGESEPIERRVDIMSDDDGTMPPLMTALHGNYPNPFNPITTISFEIKEEGHVLIEIYNIRGQKIRTLVDENKEMGRYRADWNGTDDFGRAVSSGIYFYKMTTQDFSTTRRMVMMK